MSEPKPERRSEPIWYRPGWITAMVAVVSLFLTVPERIAEHLAKDQEIELAKQKLEEARLVNLASNQEREFQIVSNTLAQQGSERVFVLRYLAATLDDEKARSWADGEVHRLDELASREEQLRAATADLVAKEAKIQASKARGENRAALETEIKELSMTLAAKSSEVSELRARAGIGGKAVIEPRQRSQQLVFTYDALITFDSPEHPPISVTPLEHIGQRAGPDFPCPSAKRCEINGEGRAPNLLRITPGSSFLRIAVKETLEASDGQVLEVRDIQYICELEDSTFCSRSPMLSSPESFVRAN